MTPLRREELDAIAAAGSEGWLPPGFYALVALGLLAVAAFGVVLL